MLKIGTVSGCKYKSRALKYTLSQGVLKVRYHRYTPDVAQKQTLFRMIYNFHGVHRWQSEVTFGRKSRHQMNLEDKNR